MMLKTLQLTLLVLSILLINGQSAFANNDIKVKTWNVETFSVESLTENQNEIDDCELDDTLLVSNFSVALFSSVNIANLNYSSIKTPAFLIHFIRAPPVNS